MRDGHASFEPYLEVLRSLPFARRVRVLALAPRWAGTALDAMIEVETAAGRFRLPCERTAAHLQREVAARLVELGRRVPRLLVFAPYVGAELGERFAQAGVNFIDLVGNCHLRLGQRFFARVQGRRPAVQPMSGKALRAASYRVLFALLVKPDLVDTSARELAAASGGVSPQTASDLRSRLVQLGLLERSRRHHRWADAGQRHGRDLWLAGYTATLLPHLLLGRFRARETTVEQLEPRLGRDLGAHAGWRWGGGAAAWRLTGFYRGDQTCVYVHQAPAALAERLGLVRDVAGPIALIRSPGPAAFESPHRETVHPLLVYADLLAEGHDRARETAHELLVRYLEDAGDTR